MVISTGLEGVLTGLSNNENDRSFNKKEFLAQNIPTSNTYTPSALIAKFFRLINSDYRSKQELKNYIINLETSNQKFYTDNSHFKLTNEYLTNKEKQYKNTIKQLEQKLTGAQNIIQYMKNN